MNYLKTATLLLAGTLLIGCQPGEDEATESTGAESGALADILAGEHRSERNRERDRYRNPAETLSFFGVSPADTVVEINPGGGWYMEILGPYLREEGQYIAATPDPNLEGMPSYYVDHAEQITKRIDEQPEIYGGARVQFYDPSRPVLGEPESADKVLTFRNVHNWINDGKAEAMFTAFAEVLKPGGVLGVVQHRAAEGAKAVESAERGYVPEDAVIALAQAAGLTLDGRSEINVNPRDTRHYPEGVWTLPPTLRLGQEEISTYRAIGESDRMTLRFVKPVE